MRRRDLLAALAASSVGTWSRGAVAQPGPRGAVVIGVGRTGGLPPLRAALNAAREVGEWLRGEGFEVHEISDATTPVTVHRLLDTVREFVARGNLHQLVVYFGGHGVLVNLEERWLLSGAPENPNEAVALTSTVEYARTSGIPSIVLISDVCRSRAESFQVERIGGASIFPNLSPNVAIDPEVDRFFAARPGDPAWEIPVDRSTSAYRAKFTTALLSAFEPGAPELVRCVDSVPVVPNRVLKESRYLERRMSTFVQDYGLNVQQTPQFIIESSERVYIGRARSLPPQIPCAQRVRTDRTLEEEVLEFLRMPDRPERQSKIDASPDLRAFGERVDQLLNVIARAKQTTMKTLEHRTRGYASIIVVGGQVSRLAVTSLLEIKDIVRREDNGVVQVWLNLRKEGGSVVLAFHDFVMPVAALAGYVATVVMEDERPISVSWAPGGRHEREEQYREVAGELARRSAVVDVAARFGALVIDGPREQRLGKARALLSAMSSSAGLDPSIALHAAHAFAEAGLADMVKMLDEGLTRQLGIQLFDTALLAGRLADLPHHKWALTAPICPMLVKSWNWLGIRRTSLPPVVEAQRKWLRQGIWTTFEPAAFEPLATALARGELI